MCRPEYLCLQEEMFMPEYLCLQDETVCGQCQSVSWLFVVLASAAGSAGLTALLQHLTQLLWPDTTAFSLSNFIHLCLCHQQLSLL